MRPGAEWGAATRPGCARRRRRGTAIEQESTADAGFALFELAPRLTRLENAVLREVDPALTFRQYRILQRVAQGRTTVTALGRLATITLPAVSESVDVLVRKGLLRRRTDPRDRRAAHLELTAEGRRALTAAQALLAEVAEQVLEGIPADRRPLLAEDVREVIDRVTRILVANRDGGSRAAVEDEPAQRPTA